MKWKSGAVRRLILSLVHLTMTYRGDFMSDSITVRLPKELRSQLKKISCEDKVPVSDLVRESLSRFIATRRFQRLRNQTLPFAEAQGLLTDEDIFKTVS